MKGAPIVPASWEGWLVWVICVVLFFIFKLGDLSQGKNRKIIIFILMAVGLIFIYYVKGERPLWQWRGKKEESPSNENHEQ